MHTFFKVKTTDDIFGILDGFQPLGAESIRIEEALGRVLARDIVSSEEIPGFRRSTVDGYALSARDSFGASENLPLPLNIVGEAKMGETPRFHVSRGECVHISTGGMLPEGTDAVVMVEYTQIMDDKVVEISRPVSPLENVILPDDDVKKGQVVLNAGKRLRPQDLGVLAGLGIGNIEAFAQPKAAIISTGEELVDIEQRPRAGQVRDINRYTLGGLCEKIGAKPIFLGISRDDFDDLRRLTERGLSEADIVLLSGGSSVGVKDFTVEAFLSFPEVEILVHGVSISPGKPTIIARKGNKTLWGLPGHPVSAMVIFDVFVRRLIERLCGLSMPIFFTENVLEAELGRNIESASGREDYVRVKLVREGERILAQPILGKSGLISTMVEADGLVRVDINTEGLYKGDRVTVRLF